MVIGVDTAANVTNIVAALKANGYQFVGRYYSDPANDWKIMSVQESAAIAKAGLQRVVVFQNTNDYYEYFSEKQGTKDASAAISLAKARGQKSGSAIYFSVDYDASEKEVNGQIKEYFKAVSEMILLAGYNVGVYGSGLICRMIKSLGLASYTWLALAKDLQGSSSYKEWNINQLENITLFGVEVDRDMATGINSIGAW